MPKTTANSDVGEEIKGNNKRKKDDDDSNDDLKNDLFTKYSKRDDYNEYKHNGLKTGMSFERIFLGGKQTKRIFLYWL